MMITNGLEDRTKYDKLDVDLEWTLARAVTTGQGIGPGTIYTWKLYTIISNKCAPEIMETVRLFEHKNERQYAFEQIMHKLDMLWLWLWRKI